MTAHRLRAYIYLIIVAVIWGAAAPIIKFTLGGIDPLPFLAYRFAIASIFSIVFFSLKGLNLPKPSQALPWVFFYGILAVPLALGTLFIGLDKSTVLDVTLIGTIAPMVITIGGTIFFHDKITKKEMFGISIVLIGVIINSFYPIFSTESDTRLSGNLLILIYLLADSGSVLVAKAAVRHKLQSSLLTNFAFIIGAFILIPITIYIYGFDNLLATIVNLPLKYHLGVWYMALFSGSLAYFLYVRAQRSIEVSEATLFNYLQPVFSVPLAIFWLGEKISTSFILGAVLITVGLIIAEYKKRNSKLIAKD